MQKKIVLINDLSGFGRSSLAVWLPILSVLRMECLLMPTSILSCHTAYPAYTLRDLSEDLDPWMETWKAANVSFDAVLSGYIANEKQADKIQTFLDRFKEQKPFLVVDPAMADDGQLYSGLNEHVVEAMRNLVRRADLILPNLSEAFLLCGKPYHPHPDHKQIHALAEALHRLGPDQVVISGIERDGKIEDYVCDFKTGQFDPIISAREGAGRPGTGDVFSAVTAGLLMQGSSLGESVRQAGDFVRICLRQAQKENTPPFEGVPFELVLDRLLKL